MKKNLEKKIKKVLELKKSFKNLKTIILFKNSCLSVKVIQDFKKQIKLDNSKIKVIKNRLLKRVFDDTKFKELNNFLVGSLIFIYSNENTLDLIKKVYDFKSKNKGTDVIAGFYDEEILDSKQLEEVSKLMNIPETLQHFVGLLKYPFSNLVSTLEAISNKKEK